LVCVALNRGARVNAMRRFEFSGNSAKKSHTPAGKQRQGWEISRSDGVLVYQRRRWGVFRGDGEGFINTGEKLRFCKGDQKVMLGLKKNRRANDGEKKYPESCVEGR